MDEHLKRLIRNELIRPEAPTFPGDDAFRFRHLLIRDTAYESLPKETRAELHERFADWLDAHVSLVEQDEIVGYHLEQAVRYRRDLGHEERAVAVRAGIVLLERAAALLLRGALERLALLPELALATLEAGRFDDVVPYVAELAEAPDERARAYSLLLRAAHATSTGAG
jgi:predicted ATPase